MNVTEYEEKMKEADDWLKSMYEILSSKTDVEDIEFLQKRINLFNWMREQIYRLYGGETFMGYKEMYEFEHRVKINALEQIDVTQSRNERLEEQNKRYREALEFVNEELFHVLHANKTLDVKMFYIENAKRKLTETLEHDSSD